MAITAAMLNVVINGDDSGAQAAMARTGKSAEGFGARLKNMFQNVLAFDIVTKAIDAAAAPFEQLKSQITDIVNAGMAEQNVLSQTATVIKSTGGAAGMSAEQITSYADNMARLTGIGNQQIQSSENILLTFTDIGKNVFPQAETSILNVATAMHEDLQSATVQVGKALNDPVKGMTALQRIGVTFDATQKSLIKTYEAHGEKAKAQAIILKELAKEFGNSAVAAGQTLSGQMKRLNVTMDQAKEKIGLALIPIMQKLFDAISPLINQGLDLLSNAFNVLFPLIQQASGAIQPLATMLGGLLKEAFKDVLEVFKSVTSSVGNGKSIFTELKTVFMSVFSVVKAVALPVMQALGILFTQVLKPAFSLIAGIIMKDLWPALIGLGKNSKQIGDTLSSILIPVANILGGIFQNVVAPAIQLVWNVIKDLMPIFNNVAGIIVGNLGPALKALQGAFKQAAPFIHQIFEALNKLRPIVVMVAGVFAAVFVTGLMIVMGVIRGLIGALGGIIQVFSGVVTFISGAWDFISGIFTLNGAKISSGLNAMWTGIKNIFVGAFKAIIGFVGGFISGVIDFFKHLFDKLIGHSIVTDLINGILNWFKKLFQLPIMIGQMVVQFLMHMLQLEIQVLAIVNRMITAFLQFIGSWITKAVDALGNLVKSMLDAVASLPGKFADLAGNIISGLVNGIKNGAGKVMGAIGDMAKNALSTVGSWFGIHSPSTVFHQFGVHMMAGLANGINAAKGLATSAINGVNKSLTGAALASVGSGAITNGAAFAGASAQGGGQSAIINIDGRQVAKLLMPHIATEIRSNAAVRHM